MFVPTQNKTLNEETVVPGSVEAGGNSVSSRPVWTMQGDCLKEKVYKCVKFYFLEMGHLMKVNFPLPINENIH